MKVFAMVTTKSSGHYTDHALKTFYETTTFADDDLFFLIDNDNSASDYRGENLKNFAVLQNETPKSFAANVNQIINIARVLRADIFFLNNDLIFSPGWLEPLLIDEPWILSPLSNREVQYKTEVFECHTAMSLEYYLGKEEGFRMLAEVHRASTNGLLNVICAPFFCVKLPYSVYSKVGRFDESYGKGGGEDYDYCLRALLQGFAVKYALNSFVLHFGGKSSWSGAETRDQQNAREEMFRTRFATLWGFELAELILFEQQDVITRHAGMEELVKAGELKTVVETLWSGGRVN